MCRANHSPLSLSSTYHLLHTDAQFREPTRGRLQPISLVILLLALDDVERVDVPALRTGVLLALVQDVAVNKDKRAGFDLAHIVHLLLVRGRLSLQAIRKSGPTVFDEASALFPILACTHKPLGNRRSSVASRREAQAPVLLGCILERIPISYCARRVRVQEGAVLVGRHCATNLRLLTDDHGLKNARIAEA